MGVAGQICVEEQWGQTGTLGDALVDDDAAGFTTVVDARGCASTQVGALVKSHLTVLASMELSWMLRRREVWLTVSKALEKS